MKLRRLWSISAWLFIISLVCSQPVLGDVQISNNNSKKNATAVSLHQLFNTNQLLLITLRSTCHVIVETAPTEPRRCPLAFQQLPDDQLWQCPPTPTNVHMHLVPPGNAVAEMRQGASLLFVWLSDHRLEAIIHQIRFPTRSEADPTRTFSINHLDFVNSNSLFTGSAGSGGILQGFIIHTVFDSNQRLLYVWLSDQTVRVFQLEEKGSLPDKWQLLSLRVLKVHASLSDVERIVADSYTGRAIVVRRSVRNAVSLQSLPLSRLASFLAHGSVATSVTTLQQANCTLGENTSNTLCDVISTLSSLSVVGDVQISSTISHSTAVRTRFSPLIVDDDSKADYVECHLEAIDNKNAKIQTVAVLDDLFCSVRDGAYFSRSECDEQRLHYLPPKEQENPIKIGHVTPQELDGGGSGWMIFFIVLLILIAIILSIAFCWVYGQWRIAASENDEIDDRNSMIKSRLLSKRPLPGTPTRSTAAHYASPSRPPQPFHLAGPHDYGQTSANLDVTVDQWGPAGIR